MKGVERNYNPPELSMETMLAFLQNKLDKQETEKVEHLIQENPLYQEMLKELKESLADDPDTEEKAIQYRDAFVREVHRITDKKLYKPKGDKWHLWSMAAMILLLVIPLGYRFLMPSVEDQLRNQYFQAYVTEGMRGGDEVRNPKELTDAEKLEEDFAFAKRAYTIASSEFTPEKEQVQHYQIAIREFENILSIAEEQVPERIIISSSLYLGVSYVVLNQAKEAVPYLQKVIDHGVNVFIPDAQWYKAWALLDLGETEAAIDQFYLLANKSNDYQKRAQDIVKRLN
ncbi:MAG: hypothetical protein AAF587_17995 [Bacteroidota bacterium]